MADGVESRARDEGTPARNDFAALFARATLKAPYAYQHRLAIADPWPDALELPAAAGRTAGVILAWLWRRRGAPHDLQRDTPRRLVYCLPTGSSTTAILDQVRLWLARLALADPPALHRLEAGASDDAWMDAPERDTILVGSQEMLLSRALNRGIAMPPHQWPLAFALLHNDVQWVHDEVALMGAGASTSAQLDAFRYAMGTCAPHRSLWMGTTIDPSLLRTVDHRAPLDVMRLGAEERAELAAPLTARKRVAQLAVDGAVPGEVAHRILALHRTGTRTLVVLNRVSRAQAVFGELRRLAPSTVPLALLHPRLRLSERVALERDVVRAAWHGIVVGTAAIEVALDFSARTLVTELAPWPVLVQRFGRCNRSGEFPMGDVHWIDHPVEPSTAADRSTASCFTAGALSTARSLLKSLDDGSARMMADRQLASQGVTLPVIRRRDLVDLFDTTPDFEGREVDVSPFVRNDDEGAVYVAWRDFPVDGAPSSATAPPTADECCPLPLTDARDLLERVHGAGGHAWQRVEGAGTWQRVDRAVPGQLWLLPASAGGYDPTLGAQSTHRSAVPPLPSPPVPSAELPVRVQHPARFPSTRSPEPRSRHLVGAVLHLLERLAWDVRGAHEALCLAARWHDAGKAHPAVMAGDRPVRHEVVGALLLLERHPESFLAAYLVAAQHGRVRLVVRPHPKEPPPADGRRFAHGVWEGDVVPGFDPGDSPRPEAVLPTPRPLSLAVFELGGGGEGGMGWTARAAALRDAHAPFRLAAYESLLRLANRRTHRADEAP